MNKKIDVSLEKEVCMVTTRTLHELFKKNPDSVSLYMFYYYTAKWQETNQIKAVSSYCKKGLGWGDEKFNKAKKTLTETGLIEDFKRLDLKTKKITGWYVKLNYIFKKKTSEAVSRGVDEPVGGFQETNALSANNINALSANKERLSYESPPPDTYKTKQDIAKQKGLKLKKAKQSLNQMDSVRRLKVIDCFRETADKNGFDLLSNPSETRNKVLLKMIKDNWKRCDDWTELINWWFDGAGEWCGYSPENCFREKTIEEFKNNKPKQLKHFKF